MPRRSRSDRAAEAAGGGVHSGEADARLTELLRGDAATAYPALRELRRRHHAPTLAYARLLGVDEAAAKQLTAQAFALGARDTGRGVDPTGPWRHHAALLVRRIAAGWTADGRRVRLRPEFAAFLDAEEERRADLPAFVRRPPAELPMPAAFHSLPTRTQGVLWYGIVDAVPDPETALYLGLKADEVAWAKGPSLDVLGRAYLMAQLARHGDQNCQAYRRLIEEAVRPREPRRNDDLYDHLAQCPCCRQAHNVLLDLHRAPRTVLATGLLPWNGGAYLPPGTESPVIPVIGGAARRMGESEAVGARFAVGSQDVGAGAGGVDGVGAVGSAAARGVGGGGADGAGGGGAGGGAASGVTSGATAGGEADADRWRSRLTASRRHRRRRRHALPRGHPAAIEANQDTAANQANEVSMANQVTAANEDNVANQVTEANQVTVANEDTVANQDTEAIEVAAASAVAASGRLAGRGTGTPYAANGSYGSADVRRETAPPDPYGGGQGDGWNPADDRDRPWRPTRPFVLAAVTVALAPMFVVLLGGSAGEEPSTDPDEGRRPGASPPATVPGTPTRSGSAPSTLTPSAPRATPTPSPSTSAPTTGVRPPGGAYTQFVNASTDLCLDVRDGDFFTGNDVVMSACNTSDTQRWRFDISRGLVRSWANDEFCLDSRGSVDKGVGIRRCAPTDGLDDRDLRFDVDPKGRVLPDIASGHAVTPTSKRAGGDVGHLPLGDATAQRWRAGEAPV
ncbi:ricin-type beta-trefoil lectin domain protein [Streptomyces uncialis]|uniref:RICIN domain-containing protein n=1 Tax=Streptomyces uncialis TaxID=1048205 RepID=UPI003650989B